MLERTVIQEESYLQRYISENPGVLPLDQIQADVRPVVLLREFPTPSGPIDALAADESGNLYLIETKLYKNPDKRLVLAQVLDYGAAIWKGYSDPDDFVSRLDGLMQQRMGKGLTARIGEAYGLEGERTNDFIEGIKTNVASGRFRVVILMDTVEDRLKHLIAYVNANSQFDVLGVSLDFYRHEEFDVLIPALHGAETRKATPASAGAAGQWDEERLFAQASARLSPDCLEGLRSLFSWAKTTADDVAFGRGKTGSFNPKFAAVCQKSVFTARSDGLLTLNFQWLYEPDCARAWRERVGQELLREGFPIPQAFNDKFVTLPAKEWVPRLPALLAVLSAAVKRSSPQEGE